MRRESDDLGVAALVAAHAVLEELFKPAYLAT